MRPCRPIRLGRSCVRSGSARTLRRAPVEVRRLHSFARPGLLTMQPAVRRRLRSVPRPPLPGTRLVASASLTALLVGGCATYEPDPLDLSAHRRALAARATWTGAIDPEHDAALRAIALGGPDATIAPDVERVPPAAFDPSDGIGPTEGEVLALVFNPDLRLARLDAGVARATADHSGRWEDPVLGFDGAELLSPSGPTEWGVTVGLTIPISGRLEVERDRAGAAHEVELRRIVALEWDVRIEVRRAWSRWATATAQRDALTEVAERVERLAAVARTLQDAGEIDRSEARLVAIELAERRAAGAVATVAEHRARLDLLALLGLPPDAEVELLPLAPSEATTGAVDADDAGPLLPDELADRLAAGSVALAVHRAEHAVAEESLRLEVRRQYPDLELGGGYGDEDGSRILFGVSLPIPVWNANTGPIAEARAARDRARARFETAWERLAADLASARLERRAAARRRLDLEREIVPMLDEQTQELDRLVELGAIDVLLLLETVARSTDVRLRLLELRHAETDAALEIERLLGMASDAGPRPDARSASDAAATEPSATPPAAPQPIERRAGDHDADAETPADAGGDSR